MIAEDNLNQNEVLNGLDKTEQRLIQAYRNGQAEEIICALEACGSLPAHWPEHPDRH